MPDYRHALEFGVFPTHAADDVDGILELVRVDQELGIDIASVQDHPYQRRHLDAWTLLSALGARTSIIKLAPDVASLPLRPRWFSPRRPPRWT